MKAFLYSLALLTAPAFAEDIKETDRFKDRKSGEYFHVCGSTENGKLLVARYCGKYEKKVTRLRTDLNKIVKEYKDLKDSDRVMLLVEKTNDNKEKEPRWILGTISTLYEDGAVDVMEYSSHHGFNPGTALWSANYVHLSKVTETADRAVCAKEDMVIVDGNYNEKKYNISKGEKLTIKETFENGYVAVRLDGFLINLKRYGHDNKLPVLASKVGPCSEDLAVNDGNRSMKESSAEAHDSKDESRTISK